jgi:hypothetical protein
MPPNKNCKRNILETFNQTFPSKISLKTAAFYLCFFSQNAFKVAALLHANKNQLSEVTFSICLNER